MGTRHLIAVYLDGEYKIAQYGQWDGYPEGQGVSTLAFAREIAAPTARRLFKEKLRQCRWITENEIEYINEKIRKGIIEDWTKIYPELDRDTGSDILKMVFNSKDGMALQNSITFAADSLFCEWAWVIDLDKKTFEGYKGFNTTHPATQEDRFYFLKDEEEKKASERTMSGDSYYCVRLVKSYSLDDLPSDATFLHDFVSDDEEEDIT